MSQFTHSIKVPTQYKATAKILKAAIEKQKSIKSLIFEEKHAVSNVIFGSIARQLMRATESFHINSASEACKRC